jgi:TIR domain
MGEVRHVAAPRSPGTFICYRRSDAAPYARLLKVQLSRHLPGTSVFMDLDSIEAGKDFEEAIKKGVYSCGVLVALIGPRWLGISDEDGRRRLDNPDDYVRLELRTALQRCIRVIPVLVDGARMPSRHQLPDDLGKLARLNALKMSYDRYEYDEGRLVTLIQNALQQETPIPSCLRMRLRVPPRTKRP